MDLQVITTRMNAKGYQPMLRKADLVHGRPRICRDDWVFQQDNSIHSVKSTKKWLKMRKIDFLHWPARSPDLSPSA